jgi:putative glutamine amidotransferase
VYGSQDHPLVSLVDDDRDRLELDLFRRVCDEGKPFLGICRGIQLINIALGGTLYEDILDQRPPALKHDQSQHARNFLAHSVEVADGSRLRGILGSGQVEVNSLHHQGLRQLAPGVKATAYAADGLVEAIELPGHRFGLAVQWHPEWLQEHQSMRDLFRAFVRAAEDRD